VVLVLASACANEASPAVGSHASSTPTPSSPTAPGSNRILARIPLPWTPTLIASGYGSLWIVSDTERMVARLDPKTNRIVGAPARLSERIYEIVSGDGGVWVSDDTMVTRLDPESGQVVASLRDQFGDGTPFRMAEGAGLVWVLNLEGAPWGSHVYRISPQTNRFVGQPATVGAEALSIAFGAGSLWSADHDASTVSRVDPRTNRLIAAIPAASEPHFVYFSPEAHHVWVANYHTFAVTRIDPRTNRVVGPSLRVPFAPEWMTSGNGKVWVLPSPSLANHPQGVKSIAEFDLNRLDQPEIVPLEGVPMDAEWSDGALWVTLQAPNMIVKVAP